MMEFLKKYNLKIIKVWEVKVLKTRFLKMGAFEKLNQNWSFEKLN